MNEDRPSSLTIGDVGRSRKVSVAYSETMTQVVEGSAHEHLGPGVALRNFREPDGGRRVGDQGVSVRLIRRACGMPASRRSQPPSAAQAPVIAAFRS